MIIYSSSYTYIEVQNCFSCSLCTVDKEVCIKNMGEKSNGLFLISCEQSKKK